MTIASRLNEKLFKEVTEKIQNHRFEFGNYNDICIKSLIKDLEKKKLSIYEKNSILSKLNYRLSLKI
jgi:hypothetical protein